MTEKRPAWRSSSREGDGGLDDVEARLSSRFSQAPQVPPQPEFVQSLRRRLMSTPAVIIERRTQLVDALLALGIVMGGILILASLISIIYELFVRVGLIRRNTPSE